MPETLEQIICYEAWSGVGGDHDAHLVYDEWAELLVDVKAALDHGRCVLLERTLMTRAEYEDGGVAPDDDIARFRGEQT